MCSKDLMWHYSNNNHASFIWHAYKLYLAIIYLEKITSIHCVQHLSVIIHWLVYSFKNFPRSFLCFWYLFLPTLHYPLSIWHSPNLVPTCIFALHCSTKMQLIWAKLDLILPVKDWFHVEFRKKLKLLVFCVIWFTCLIWVVCGLQLFNLARI